MSNIKLTHYSKASGCGCKIAPAALKTLLKTDFIFNDPRVLVGNANADDAAVYALNENELLISTTDFFMPIVDDAFDFGKIAACNALSDVYAMGGKPYMAIAILGWPTQQLPPELAAKVLDGARTVCHQAGISVAGGHSIESTEPFFGLAVTGGMPTSHLKQNHTLQVGDAIYLSKPLGTGILSAALKRGALNSSDYERLLTTMCTLNSLGAELGALPYITAMTDVTGFGLVGHALEMIGAKPLNIHIQKTQVPFLPNLAHYQNQFIYPDNTTRNFSHYETQTQGMIDLDFMLYCDPQTSGGLLFSVSETHIAAFEAWCIQNKKTVHAIGKVLEGQADEKGKVIFL